jgi:phosphoribosylglycinamide formyltransferase-1
MAAIVQAAKDEQWEQQYEARIVGVISNRPNAGGLAKAKAAGIATEVVDHTRFPDRAAFDAELAKTIDAYKPGLVVLAGFMRLLTAPFVRRYSGKIINIHPSLLPAFKGLHTHARAIEAGCTTAGATVHQVTEALDDGDILAQAAVPVLPGDTPDSLAARVLVEEHRLYPKAIAQFLASTLGVP